MMQHNSDPLGTALKEIDSGGPEEVIQTLAEETMSATDFIEQQDEELQASPASTVGTFFVGDLELALGANQVREVVAFPEKFTPIAQSAQTVVGLFSLRGEIMPMLDVASLLGVERSVALSDCRVAIVDVGDSHVGMLFGRTGEVLRIPPEDCFPMAASALQPGMIIDGVIQLDEGRRFVQRVAPELVRKFPGIPFTEGSPKTSQAKKTPTVYHKAVVARVGEHCLAFPIENLVEIRQKCELQASPSYFDHCKGVLNVRGSVFAVMGLRSYLDMEPDHPEGKLIFVQHDNVTIALEVDSLVAALEYPEAAALPMPALPKNGLGGFCRQALQTEDEAQILLADVAALFERNEIVAAASILYQRDLGGEPVDESSTLEEDRSLFTFEVGSFRLSLDMNEVLEVQPIPEDVVQTGTTTGALQGIMNLRGTIVPLVDLRILFNADLTPTGSDSGDVGEIEAEPVIIVIESQGKPHGMIVDRIESVVRFQHSQASEVPNAIQRGAVDGIMPYVRSALMLPNEASNGQVVLVLSADALAASAVGE